MKRIPTFLILASLCLSMGCGGGTDVAGGITLGFALEGFADRLETVVRTAGEAGRGVVIQAGTEAYVTIQNAKVAYDDSLDKSVKKLDDATTKKLQEIESLVQDVESNLDDKIATVAAKSQQIANTLPFANTKPQVTIKKPKFFTPSSSANQWDIEIGGNFMFAQQEKLVPSLLVGDKVYAPAENTTQILRFLVTAPSAASEPKISMTKMRLTIPYESKSMLVFTTRKDATYNLLFGTLPTRPGTISIEKKTVHDETETQPFSTQNWRQWSSDDDYKDVHYEGPVPSGWSVVPNSSKCVVTWAQGDEGDQWSRALVRENPTVVYRMTTIHHSIGTSGKVDFHFEYTIQRPKPVTNSTTEDLDLAWGQSRAIPVEPNKWKIIYKPFDGEKQEIVGPFTSRFLNIQVEGDNVVVKVLAAGEIKY